MTQRAERRRHPRRPCRLRVRLRGAREFREHYITDMGTGGVFVETVYPLRIGSPVDLELLVGDDPMAIRVPGEVVWVRSGAEGVEPGMGVRFVDLSQQTMVRLKRLLDPEWHG